MATLHRSLPSLALLVSAVCVPLTFPCCPSLSLSPVSPSLIGVVKTERWEEEEEVATPTARERQTLCSEPVLGTVSHPQPGLDSQGGQALLQPCQQALQATAQV